MTGKTDLPPLWREPPDLAEYQRQFLEAMKDSPNARTMRAVFTAEFPAVPYEGLVPVHRFAQSGGQIAEVMARPHGARIEFSGRASGKFAQLGYDVAMTFIDEAKELTMDETTAPPQATPTDPAGAPPSRVSNDVNHPDFHPSYMRVGVKVDGVDRTDLKWFDAQLGRATTTNGTRLEGKVEPYWRTAENRQQRRARERWELKHGKART